MTASEAKLASTWRSLPPIIRVKIERATEWGEFYALFYKSVTPEAFDDIHTTLLKLQLLGYNTEYGKVDIADDNEAVGISTDTKLTIKWQNNMENVFDFDDIISDDTRKQHYIIESFNPLTGEIKLKNNK